MTPSPSNPWHIPHVQSDENLPPTWAEFSTIPFQTVQEIGAALSANYSYFLAPLTPERTFLHYLISSVICNVELEKPGDLETIVKKLYEDNIDSFKRHVDGLKPLLDNDLKHHRKMAEAYYAFRSEHPREDLPQESPLSVFAADMDAAIAKIYENRNNPKDPYIPGTTAGSGNVDPKLKLVSHVFAVGWEAHWAKLQSEDLAKKAAKKIVKGAIAAGKLKEAPYLERSADAHNIVLTGITAAGKTRLMAQMEKEGKIDRKKSVVIDIDEFRDLDSILETPNTKTSDPYWGARVHDECHMIRRKVLDELTEQATKSRSNPHPRHHNVVLMTAHLSQRMRDYLFTENKHTDVYFLYTKPERAIQNAHIRAQKHDGYSLSPATILKSFQNLAESMGFVLTEEVNPHSNVSIKVLDTSKVEYTEDGLADITKAKPVLETEKSHGVVIYNINTLMEIFKGWYIDPKAPRHSKYRFDIKEHEWGEFYDRVRACLFPHRVTLVGKFNERIIKQPGEDEFKGETAQRIANYSDAFRVLYVERNQKGPYANGGLGAK